MKRYISLCTAIFFCTKSYSQRPNLVPNPGFENLLSTPCDPMIGELSQYISGWQQGTHGTADILTEKSPANCYANPNSSNGIRIGSEDPHGGESMGLIMTSVHGDYREYLGCNLTKSLEIGRQYHCEVYVSLADYSGFATNNIGFLFRTGQYRIENGYQVFATPQVNCTTVISTTTGWVKVSGTFTADQAYTYFLIGNFLPEEQITKQKNNSAGTNEKYVTHCAYYIDDVNVCRTSDLEAHGDSIVTMGTTATFIASGGLPNSAGVATYSWADTRNPGVVLGTDAVLRIKVDKKTTFRVTCGDEFADVTVNVKTMVINYLTDLGDRKVKKGRTIIVHHETIEINVYDKYQVDGDSISLYYGDSLIAEHVALTHDMQTFTIRIDKNNPKQIILFAENLGSSPPNTAAMAVEDGRDETEVILSSDYDSCDSFMILFKEDD